MLNIIQKLGIQVLIFLLSTSLAFSIHADSLSMQQIQAVKLAQSQFKSSESGLREALMNSGIQVTSNKEMISLRMSVTIFEQKQNHLVNPLKLFLQTFPIKTLWLQYNGTKAYGKKQAIENLLNSVCSEEQRQSIPLLSSMNEDKSTASIELRFYSSFANVESN